MENHTYILDSFLEKWTIEKVKNMILDEYVSVNNKETFCQWVETKTVILGKINSPRGSIKFGIYKRTGEPKYKYALDDEEYTWNSRFGSNRNDAFKEIRENIVCIIELAQKGQFHEIEKIKIENIFKWKIAHLYSNKRLIPIYSIEILKKICGSFGLNNFKKAAISEMQECMIQNKPSDIDVYQFCEILISQFNQKKSIKIEPTDLRKIIRKESKKYKSIEPQFRSVAYSKFISQNILYSKIN